MYYPFLRGKQFELILLRENVDLLATNNFHPIIEPVKEDFTALIRAMDILKEKNVQCTLIINPEAGQKPVDIQDILKTLIDDTFINFSNLSIGYMLHAESEISELVKYLKKYKENNFSIVHRGFGNSKKLAEEISPFKNIKNHIFIDGYAGKLYQKNLNKIGINKVLIRNGFKPQQKNADYPPSEHFSDLHITFTEEGNMSGFGDYLIAGDEYSESGGPAYAVAIHLTYLDDEDMFIYHFVSDKTDSPTDPGGKFLEALTKLEKKIENPKSLIYKSKACMAFLELYKKKHFPGLGSVKKLSMQHHLELMASFLNEKTRQ